MTLLNVKALRWGNSYALRITKRDFERLGLHEGQTVSVDLVPEDKRIDVRHFTFHSGHTDTSVRHDEALYGWRSDE